MKAVAEKRKRKEKFSSPFSKIRPDKNEKKFLQCNFIKMFH